MCWCGQAAVCGVCGARPVGMENRVTVSGQSFYSGDTEQELSGCPLATAACAWCLSICIYGSVLFNLAYFVYYFEVNNSVQTYLNK